MSHRLQVLIPQELDTQIDKAAQRSRVSKGEWVRQALKASLRGGSKTNPVERMAALACPAGDIDRILAEIDEGRR
jgi:metal-responsive CopG/Arc/MetJ family transcriptional regulator